jgi:hypothetical protein
MSCPSTLVDLPCNLCGVGFTAKQYTNGDDTVTLMKGHGAKFPEVPAGKHYYIQLTSACSECCVELRVVGKAGDTLTVQYLNAATCLCIGTNATVRFKEFSRYAVEDIIATVGIKVLPPLVYNCATHTLSLDCSLMVQPCAPCAS